MTSQTFPSRPRKLNTSHTPHNVVQPLTPSPTESGMPFGHTTHTPPYTSSDDSSRRRPQSTPRTNNQPNSESKLMPPPTFSPRHFPAPSSSPIPPSTSSPTYQSHFAAYPYSYPTNSYFAPPPWQNTESFNYEHGPSTSIPATASSPTKNEVRSGQPPRPPNAWIIYRSEKLRLLGNHEDLEAVVAELGLGQSSSDASPSSDDEGEEADYKGKGKGKKAKGKKSHPPTEATFLGRGKGGRGLPQADISKMISMLWKREKLEVKQEYERQAEAKKIEHQVKYPGYKFQPQRKADKLRLREEKEREKEAAKREKEVQRSGGTGRSKKNRPRARVSPTSPYSLGANTGAKPTMTGRSLSYSGNTEGHGVFWAGVPSQTAGQGHSEPLTPAGYNHRSYPFPIPAGSLPSMSAEGSSDNTYLGEQAIRPQTLEPTAPPPHDQPSGLMLPPGFNETPPLDRKQSSTTSHQQSAQEMCYPGFDSYNTNSYQQPISMPFLHPQPGQIPDDMTAVPMTYEIVPLSPGNALETLDSYGDEPDKLAAMWCMLEPDEAGPSGSGGGEMESYAQSGDQQGSIELSQSTAELLNPDISSALADQSYYQAPRQPTQQELDLCPPGYAPVWNPNIGNYVYCLSWDLDRMMITNAMFDPALLPWSYHPESQEQPSTRDDSVFLPTQALSPPEGCNDTYLRPTNAPNPSSPDSRVASTSSVTQNQQLQPPPRHISASAYPTPTSLDQNWNERSLSFAQVLPMEVGHGSLGEGPFSWGEDASTPRQIRTTGYTHAHTPTPTQTQAFIPSAQAHPEEERRQGQRVGSMIIRPDPEDGPSTPPTKGSNGPIRGGRRSRTVGRKFEGET